jgi:hypothetical protein
MKGRIAVMTASLLLPLAAAAAPTDPNVRIDPRADSAVRHMSDYLSGLQSFRFRGASVTDMVTPEGQKVETVADQRVAIKRPNRFRTDRQDPLVDATVRYDGRMISIYGKRTGYYATAPMPPNMSDAVDTLRDRFGIEAPAADLFLEDPYSYLMQDVQVGRYVGIEPIDGVPCHHLAFQGKDVDWQIWIEDGVRPLPRRYSIVSKHDVAQPEFGIMLSDWEPKAPLPDSEFAFTPPPGATRIELRTLERARTQGRRGGAR